MNASSEAGGRPTASASYPVHERTCPHCNGAVDRVRRRFIDRLISLVLPRYRYRCCSIVCDWEGSLPKKRLSPVE